MKRSINLLIIVMLMLTVVVNVEAEESTFQVTVKDDLNNNIKLNQKPERIISLAPSITEMLFAIGLNEEIVGVTKSANYPQAALKKEKIGTITEPNLEKIVSLKPDLVICAAINKMQTIDKLKKLGLKVAGFSPADVDETLITLKKVGRLTGKSEKARDIVTDMYIKLIDLKNIVDSHLKKHERPQVFYEIWSNPLLTAGDNTFIDDLIELAGGDNIGDQAQGSWPQYSMEKLILENPEVYISTPHSAPGDVTIKSIKNRDKFNNLKAVKNDRIHLINQDLVSRPSPRIIKGFKLLIKAIFPELAHKVDEVK